MRRLIGITVLGLFAFTVFVYSQSSGTKNSLTGAWKVTEIADTNGPPITNPQPGLYIFTTQHYSFARINGTKPLPSYPSNDKATDAEKVTVFNSLYLNTGTYTASGNVLATNTCQSVPRQLSFLKAFCTPLHWSGFFGGLYSPVHCA